MLLSPQQSKLGNIGLTQLVIVLVIIFLIAIGIIYRFERLIPPKTTSSPFPQTEETITASDKKPGCVFSLRFDSETISDSTIKAEVREELNGIRTQLLSGKEAKDLVQEILYAGGQTQWEEQVSEFMKKRQQQEAPLIPANPYRRFNIASAPIFCFANLQELTTKLGKPFIEENPTIISTFNLLAVGDVSPPFVIYKSAYPKIEEYAWMIITKLQ